MPFALVIVPITRRAIRGTAFLAARHPLGSPVTRRGSGENTPDEVLHRAEIHRSRMKCLVTRRRCAKNGQIFAVPENLPLFVNISQTLYVK